MQQPANTPRFLSLKWKVALLFTLVLVSINTVLVFLGYQQLQRQFDFFQTEVRQQQFIELKGLIENGFKAMQQLAVTVPLLDQNQNPSGDYLNHLQTLLDSQLHILSLEWGIEGAMIFDRQNRAVNPNSAMVQAAELAPWIAEVIQSETPVALFYCNNFCGQYVITPLLHQGQNVGALLLERSIADLVLTFKQVTDNDLVLFLQHDKTLNAMRIEAWDGRVVALSSPMLNMPLLQQFAQHTSLDELQQRFPQQLSNQRIYELHELSFAEAYNAESLRFLVLRDLTTPLQEIDLATRNNLIAGVLGLLVSVGLLLSVLRHPLVRIEKMATILPGLAAAQFSEVRGALQSINRAFWRRDEIDTLGSATESLSVQLEELQHQVADYTGRLELQRDSLQQERDFSNHLMDTAQVLIFTHDQQGQILSANRFAEIETGYAEAEL